MNLYIQNQYRQYLVEYLKQQYGLELKNLKKEFKCPICQTDESATIYPNNPCKFYCASPECTFKEGDIFDLIKKTKNPKFKDNDVAHYLNHKFKIPIIDDIQDLLKLYEKNGFCMFPLEPGTKNPQKGFLWTEKEYRDAKIWNDWVDRGYGLAIRLGKVSNVIAIDIDDDKTYKKMKDLLGEETLIQTTLRGKHFLYIYDEDFNFLKHVNLRNKGYDMEIRANNAYIAVAPTSANGEVRKWNNKKISKMSPKLKMFFLDLIDKDTKSVDEEIQDSIDSEDIKYGLKDMDGRCNDTFIIMGGKLRKKMSIDNTKYALNVFNKALDAPMDNKAISGIIRQLDKYKTYDKQELADEVIKRLEIIKVATAYQIAGSLRKEIKDIEDVLKYLEDQGKVLALGNRRYQMLEEVEWTTEKKDMSIPVDFQVPYFHDYNYFDWGNMVIIGASSGRGKCITSGYLSTNQGFIDIKDIGERRPSGVSKVHNSLRLFTGKSKDKIYKAPNYFYKETVYHTIKIKTDYGFEIEGTPEHPILIIDSNNKKSFKKLKDITIQDRALIVIPNRFPKEDIRKSRKLNYKQKKKANNLKGFDYNYPITPEMARLFGYILGDANIEQNAVKIYQDTKYPNIITDICDLYKKIGLDYKIYKRENHNIIAVFNAEFVQYLRVCLFGIRKGTVHSPKREIPKRILKGNKDIHINFIAGLLNAESSLNWNKYSGNLEITMASKKLIDLLQLLLLNLGIISKKTLKKVKTYPDNNYYRLTFTSEMTEKILNIISPIKYKDIKFDKNYNLYKKVKFIGNNQFLKNTYFRDKIIDITHIYETKDVYDFNIENEKYKINNQFWSNGFVSHNTHITGNIIKKLVDQGIKPYLITTEAGSKIGKITNKLGIPDEMYYVPKKPVKHPMDIELVDNAVTIIDWLKVKDGDWAKTDMTYEHFHNQLKKHGGFLFIFTQLRVKNNEFFAPDLTNFYGSCVVKYLFGNNNEDAENTLFQIEKLRDSRTGQQWITVPTHFDKDTKILEIRK